MTWREGQGRHANGTRMTILRGMGDITDERIQIQLFKIISFSPISFKYTVLHPGSKIRVYRWAEETSLTGCIDWMGVSLSWEDVDSLTSVQTYCIWRNLFGSENGLSKSIDRKRMGGCLEVMWGEGVTSNGQELSFRGDKIVLKLGCGDGCLTL